MTEMHNIYPCLKVGHQVGLGLGGRGGVPALVQSRAVHTGPVARVVKIKNLILLEKKSAIVISMQVFVLIHNYFKYIFFLLFFLTYSSQCNAQYIYE